MNNKKIYQVLFSFMSPREGYIPIEAETEDEARKIVTDLMANNYDRFTIASITETDQLPLIATGQQESEKMH